MRSGAVLTLETVNLGEHEAPEGAAQVGQELGNQGFHECAPSGLGPVRLVGLLGQGGMAQVYLGHHETLDRAVAVKRLRPQLAGLEQARARLRTEAEIARGLRHDHIVDVLDLVTDPAGETYLVMEHVAGEPLSARIARTGGLPLSEALTISMQVADALGAVHRRGILHRDLKTENVLVGLDADGELLAKLIDFGVAEILGSPDGMIDCTAVVGTPESMSPEQARAEGLDRRSDIYSFGVLMYEMLAGMPPFQSDDLPSLMDRLIHETPLPPSRAAGAQKQLIPTSLEQLTLECLAKSRDERPQDMSEVSLRLELIAAQYRTLADAIERAMTDDTGRAPSGRGTEREIKQALVVIEEQLASPVSMPSPVRAVGTSDDSQVSRLAPMAAVAPGFGGLVIDPVPARALVLPPSREARKPRRWLRRLAGASLLLAVVAASGLVGYRVWTSDRPGLEFPWHR